MSVIISSIKTSVNSNEDEITESALKKLGISRSDTVLTGVYKTSLDARDNNNIKLVSSVWLETDEELENKLCEKFDTCSKVKMQDFQPKEFGQIKPDGRIVIVGFGPAGMFSALTLAEYGYRPIVIERGDCVDKRIEKVNNFWSNGILDTESNVQFGEGGAGTFSDGKLTTRIKDPLCRHILKKLAELGAPKEILTKAKPHIGTDKLRDVVRAIRNRILELGGDIRFNSAVTDLIISDGRIKGITINNSETINASAVVMAIGHSARDTFEMLLSKNITLEAKPFSVGARIEHFQEDVNKSLYGKQYNNPFLPKGEYQLSLRKGDRAVYTFCMCPGGFVVPAQSEENSIVTNGMSEHSRNGEYANSAVAVSVSPDDFGRNPLDGVEFARLIEKKAFSLCNKNYSAPATTVGKFLTGYGSVKESSIKSSYSLGITECDFNELFPSFITDMLKLGLNDFSSKMKCFSDKNAILTAPETRTSSPVRILRGEDMQSVSIKGLYPCGEGAGYAGGIMSASVDGVKTAERIISVYKA